MTAWRFKAVDGKGRAFDGEMDAPDEAAVLARIRRDGAMPLAVTQARGGGLGSLSWSFGRGDTLTRQDVTNITRELSTMLGAGQDIDRALRFLVETAPNRRSGRVLAALRDDVRNGNTLAAAMAKQSGSFSRLYVGLVRAGEAGGTLPATLEQLADLLERERSLASTIQSALIYPALLLVAACGAVVLLLTQVLPEFVPLFEQSGVALPASTQFLIDTGDVVSRYGLHRFAGRAAAVPAVPRHAAPTGSAPRIRSPEAAAAVCGWPAAGGHGGTAGSHAWQPAGEPGLVDHRAWHHPRSTGQSRRASRPWTTPFRWPRQAPVCRRRWQTPDCSRPD